MPAVQRWGTDGPALILTYAPDGQDAALDFVLVLLHCGLLDGRGYNGVLLMPRPMKEANDG